MGEKGHGAVGVDRSGDHAIRSLRHLLNRLTTANRMSPHRPFGRVLAGWERGTRVIRTWNLVCPLPSEDPVL